MSLTHNWIRSLVKELIETAYVLPSIQCHILLIAILENALEAPQSGAMFNFSHHMPIEKRHSDGEVPILFSTTMEYITFQFTQVPAIQYAISSC